MNKIYEYLRSLNIEPNQKVVLACSYGPDSMCLLDILIKLNISVVVAHVNHNLREESLNEYNDLKKYCDKHNIILEYFKIDEYPKCNIESYARKKRYDFFDKICKKYNSKYLFTAHHGDDLIETILMRIFRGSTFKGYAGFKLISKKNSYEIVRPLIYTTKYDIIKYCNDNNILYALDKTNNELYHTRNIIRHKILPEIKQINPLAHEKFIKYSELLNEYYNYVNDEVLKYKSNYYINNKLDINSLNEIPPFIIKLLIQSILLDIYKDNISLIEDKHVKLIMDLIENDKANISIDLPNKIKVIKFYNNIEFKENYSYIDYDYILIDKINTRSGLIEIINETDIIKSNFLLRLNSKEISLPLHVRNRRIKDKMKLKNGSKKIGEILSENKMKKEDRITYPIITDNNNEILWVPGIKKGKFDKQNDDDYDIIVRYIERKDENNYEK